MIKEYYSSKYYCHNIYYRQETINQTDIEGDSYRNTLGGTDVWYKTGNMQLEMLLENGLHKNMKFLEVGCGCLRAGSHIINYLNPYNYYGIDVNKKLLTIGVENELKRNNLLHKVNYDNFILTDCFDIKHFNVKFDMGLSNFVFCYLSLNHLIYFLNTAGKYFNKNGKLIISFGIVDDDKDLEKTHFDETDPHSHETSYTGVPYFIKMLDIQMICNRPDIPWRYKLIDTHFPISFQKYILFERL